MTDEKKIIQEQETQQQHLQGGQESPDMGEFRERLHDELMHRERIIAIGNICMHLEFLTDAFNAMVEKQQETNDTLKTIQAMLQDENENSIGVIASDADSQLSGINNRLAGVVVESGNINEAIQGVETALYPHGSSIGNSLLSIAAEVKRTCDPDEDHRVKVYVDGDIHPY